MEFTDFFSLSSTHFLVALLISTINAVLLVLIASKFLQILQISGYKIKGYAVWLSDTKAKYISRILMLCFLSLAGVLVTNALFDVANNHIELSYLGLIFYIYFSVVFILNMIKPPQKTPLVQTRRMSRITTLLFLLCFITSLLLIWLASSYFPYLSTGIIVLTPILLPFYIPLAHFILLPLEGLIRQNYIRRAKKKLAKMPNLIKIGITGSFGKTSVKHILNMMLSQKFNVCMSPHSFNTPMGLTKVILKYLKPDNEILIAEMGARHVGDINYLCKLIQPNHGIITGIGLQHFETFDSEENIIKTKNELVLFLPEDANVVFNGDNKKSKQLFKESAHKNKFMVTLDEKSEIKAKNIKSSENGIEFDLEYKNKTIKCETCLLGRHNLLNILLSACMAIKFRLSLEQISVAISEIEPIKHRLEPILNKNMIILDDAYSSNEEGAKAALEVLKSFENRIKICVTPGIVELGKEEKRVNENFGKLLATTCDYVIVVNKINAESLKKGLNSKKIAETKVFYVETLNEAKQQLNKLIVPEKLYVILFENDLPDNYT